MEAVVECMRNHHRGRDRNSNRLPLTQSAWPWFTAYNRCMQLCAFG